MSILAIETATAVCAVAIIERGSVRSERSLDSPHVHSEKLVTLIDETLQDAKVSRETIEGIAISIGPGSFTGLRIGLSVAKGLAFAWGKPLVAVSTLEALAMSAIRQGLSYEGQCILSMIDARRDEVYAALYRQRRNVAYEIQPPQALSLSKVVTLIGGTESVILTGDGAEKLERMIMLETPSLRKCCQIPSREQRSCSAVSVGVLGEIKLLNNYQDDIASLEPMYVKDFYTLIKTQRASG